MKKEFRSVVFDQKSFEIKDGTRGMYQISDVKKVSILNEEAIFKGKTEPFLHQVLGGVTFLTIGDNKCYLGLKIKLNNEQVLAVYVSQKAVSYNTDEFKKDQKEAFRIKEVFQSFKS
ncbi:hypothetical protein [Floccifex sp.]|uniref:hypothetical protein n=1 Tax=Floccifex sp. TaxID=2815810 RepID=UPI003F0B8749